METPAESEKTVLLDQEEVAEANPGNGEVEVEGPPLRVVQGSIDKDEEEPDIPLVRTRPWDGEAGRSPPAKRARTKDAGGS